MKSILFVMRIPQGMDTFSSQRKLIELKNRMNRKKLNLIFDTFLEKH